MRDSVFLNTGGREALDKLFHRDFTNAYWSIFVPTYPTVTVNRAPVVPPPIESVTVTVTLGQAKTLAMLGSMTVSSCGYFTGGEWRQLNEIGRALAKALNG